MNSDRLKVIVVNSTIDALVLSHEKQFPVLSEA